MLRIFRFAILYSISIGISLPHAIAESFSATVVGVSDGDTITVLSNARQFKLRLANIDCPEKSQAFGKRAKQFTSDLAFGKTVLVQGHGTDLYGRIKAEVILPGGLSLNKSLVSEGYAWCYRKYCDDPSYFTCEEEAHRLRLGLWSQGDPVAPWTYRKLRRRHRSQ